jgi:hypothetical protein
LSIKAQLSDTWEIKIFSDSDFGGNKDNRKSITGYVVFVCGTSISWKSKAQSCVTLSRREAENAALTETVRELKFVVQVLDNMCV